MNSAPKYPCTCILRSSIVRAMYKALNSAGVFMRAGKKLVAIDQPTDGSLGVVAHFEDGSKAYGDILIGADGINSATRAILFPDSKPTRTQFSGYFAVAPLAAGTKPAEALNIMIDSRTGNQAFVMPVGTSMVHWGMFESRPQASDNDSWDVSGDLVVERDRMEAIIAKWGLPERFRALAQSTQRVIRVTFTSLSPLPQWHAGNCVLIGDAAHAVLPFTGQGAGTSLEDALALSILLDRLRSNPARAFPLLHELRAARLAKVAAMGETLAQRSAGTSATTAAIGNFVLKVFSLAARIFGLNFYDPEITRYDCYDETSKFLASKAKDLGTDLVPVS
ncbi:hypothetical protein HK405_011241 [Cladochytrium tenue]|nr:hypothetical protein HK405_011241 [Cladochytrium tenue]